MGVVLWEALTCKRLFSGESEAVLVTRCSLVRPVRRAGTCPNVPPQLDALVMKALAPDPAARFSTAREMAEALVRAVPPAFPPDVGAWCERAARESITKRETLLAEIESSSGMGAIHCPSLPPRPPPRWAARASRTAPLDSPGRGALVPASCRERP